MSHGDHLQIVVLGTAQDGGVPQAGCACPRCAAAASDPALRRHPVALGATLADGRRLLVEATKALSEQLWTWGRSEGLGAPIVPDMVALTHLHLGHIQGLGEFGTEVMGRSGTPLLASEGVVAELANRRLLSPFEAVGLDAVDGVRFVRVPPRRARRHPCPPVRRSLPSLALPSRPRHLGADPRPARRRISAGLAQRLEGGRGALGRYLLVRSRTSGAGHVAHPPPDGSGHLGASRCSGAGRSRGALHPPEPLQPVPGKRG